MHVRWTEEALSQLETIAGHIQRDSPSAAQRVAKDIVHAAESLSNLPHRGRLGVVSGTRELVLSPIGYIVTYEVLGDAVFILRIHHGAQDLPR